MNVVCRDGVHARVQRVPYEGVQGGLVLFGKRFPPGLPQFDADGMANESGDLWNLDGFWKTKAAPHRFDIVHVLTGTPQHTSAHA